MDGMLRNHYTPEFAGQIVAQIRGFADYGFPEAHAASFALLAWISAWLKFHHPAAFTAALLNSQPMGFYAPAQLLRDAREHGIAVYPVDVGISEVQTTLEPDDRGEPALRLGLDRVQGLSALARERIMAARRSGGGFAGVQDLGERATLTRHDMECLAAAGALCELTGNRHLAFWRVAGFIPSLPAAPEGRRETTLPLLRTPTEAEDLFADYRALGFTLGRHPLAMLRTQCFHPHLTAETCARIREHVMCGR